MSTTLPGFSAADTVILAAAYLYAKSADVDWEAVVKLVNSKSVHSVKERVRVAKKKAVENGTLPASSSSNSPAGGIKKRPSSVAPSTPTNSKKRKLASPVKKEDLDESDVDVVLSRTAEARTGRVPVRAQVESEDEFDVEFF